MGLLSLGVAGWMALGGPAAQSLDWQPQQALTQPWRALTAAVLHLSPMHLWANIGSLIIVAALGWVAQVPRPQAWAALLAWPLTQLGLLVEPRLLHYAGLSGWLYGAIGIVIVHLVWNRPGQPRLIGAALGSLLLIKLVLERAWVHPLQSLPGWDIPIAPAAHASGAVVGVVLAVWVCRRTGKGRSQNG